MKVDEDINILIQQLQQFDNPKGYGMEYEDVKNRLKQTIEHIA